MSGEGLRLEGDTARSCPCGVASNAFVPFYLASVPVGCPRPRYRSSPVISIAWYTEHYITLHTRD